MFGEPPKVNYTVFNPESSVQSAKVFYVNQVHQMDMLWGSRGPITLDDPLYDIFLHVMLHGSLTFSIVDSRKFLVKQVGFRSRYTYDEMMNSFKGLISSHVKDCISKIMINGQMNYFMINANLFEISEAVKERLDGPYCEEHRKAVRENYNRYERSPDSNKKYGSAWKRIRDRYAAAHPLCERCLKEGRYTPVEEVHHIVPISKGGDHRESNLMSLRQSCHTKIHVEMGDR